MTRLLGLLAAALLALATTSAHAELSQSCKAKLDGKRLSLVVQTGPGGGFDLVARLLAPQLAKVTGAGHVQIKNMPSGGGLLAVRHVMENDEKDIAIGYFGLTEFVDDKGDVKLSDLTPIAGVVNQEAVWVGRGDFELTAETAGKLSLPFWKATPRITAYYYLTALSLGAEPKLIFGYTDSGELLNAMLRGEIDANPLAADTARKAIKAGGSKVILTFGDKPSANFPEAAHLLGPDGLAAKLSAGESPATIERRMKLAAVGAEFSRSRRGALVSARMNPELRGCLEEAFAIVLADQAFLDEAKAAKFELSPGSAREVQDYSAGVMKRVQELEAEFTAAREEIAKQR